MNENQKPELLAPAGSPDALDAAISAGADAVYFGADEYSARAGARNFSCGELERAVARLHAHGVRAHVTLNVQLYDRELAHALELARRIYESGADAAIVSDIGLARLMREYFPSLELHASTQASGHSVRDAEYFASLGFSRMVCARELSEDDIKTLAARSPIGVEMFIHGAICVSVSGQCLYSSVVGGRSGNRGECAQPCRLPYMCANRYPLSPKDMCLAGLVTRVLSLGVDSLKIEGRMKSPDYVYGVTSLYRRLIDEGRDASADEISSLSKLFSRSGFTDAYFKGSVRTSPDSMIGVRTDEDKEKTRSSSVEIPPLAKVPLDSLTARFRDDSPSALTLSACGRSVTVSMSAAETTVSPLPSDRVREQLCRLGATDYEITPNTNVDISVPDGGVRMRVSELNELRRRAVDALTGVRVCERYADVPVRDTIPHTDVTLTAEFLSPEQITARAKSFFSHIYLPLDRFTCGADGIVLPPVVRDRDADAVRRLAADAYERGAVRALVNSAGQVPLIPDSVTADASYRFNVCNTESAFAAHEACGGTVTLSPELTSAQMRDIAKHVSAGIIVYGRLPLMTTERCIIRAAAGKCLGKCKNGGECSFTLVDRRGVRFPMRSIPGCGTVIYNSVPVYMADKKSSLYAIGASSQHFMFTTESAGEVDEIIECWQRGLPPREGTDIKRIK